jgi:citrate lyase subunit beta/citryl-CoA lyase
MTAGVGDARTFLFAPGDRPERSAKAAASGADVVILDLEDAVAPDAKATAREHVRAWLGQRHPAVIRINAADTPWHDDDVAMITSCPGAVAAVMVPKAEDPGRLESLSRDLPAGTGIIPLIETAIGVIRTPLPLASRASCASTPARSPSRTNGSPRQAPRSTGPARSSPQHRMVRSQYVIPR